MQVTADNLWFNLREQQYQTSFPFCSNAFYLERVLETPRKNNLQKRENNDDETDDSLIQSMSDIKVSQEIAKSKPNMKLDCAYLDAKNTTCSACAPAQEETIVARLTIPDSETVMIPRRPLIKRFNVKPNTASASCISIYDEDSFHGGNCLKITPVNPEKETNELMRLLICEFVCDYNFLVYYAVKNMDVADEQDLNLVISLKNNRTRTHFKVILSDKLSENTLVQSGEIIVNRQNEKDKKFKKLQENLLSSHSGFYIPVFNEKLWTIR